MMRNSLYKTVLAGIGLGTALLALSAATIAAQAEYGTTVPSGAKSGDLVLAPCEVYLEGDDLHYPGDCGTLVVPENRKDLNSRLIALPVTRIRATGGSPLEPVFWFTGGPGGPNKMNISTDGLLQRHDFVLVGYRGIDGQVVLACPELGEAVRSAGNKLFSDTAMAAYASGAAECGKRIKSEGVDLDGYSMNQTIDDTEAARIALGYDRINLLGKSYGTRLEMIYQWRYPDSLHRVVMVAVNPPGQFYWDPLVMDEKLGQYATLCARDVYCSARTSDLVATMKGLSRNMPGSWMGVSIVPDMVRITTFISLMETIQKPGQPFPMSGPAAIDMWLDAAEGDASGMALMSLLTPLILPGMLERGHFLAMGTSAPDYLDPNRDYKTELTQSDFIIGSPFSHMLMGVLPGWPATSDQSYSEVQDSDIETLLISGSLDFSTPMRYASDSLLPHLSRGHQVVVKDVGHTASFWNSQAQARARLLNTYFDTGLVDDSLYLYQAPVFDVDKSWGGLARMLLAAAVFVLAIAVLLVVLIIRKIRRSSAIFTPLK